MEASSNSSNETNAGVRASGVVVVRHPAGNATAPPPPPAIINNSSGGGKNTKGEGGESPLSSTKADTTALSIEGLAECIHARSADDKSGDDGNCGQPTTSATAEDTASSNNCNNNTMPLEPKDLLAGPIRSFLLLPLVGSPASSTDVPSSATILRKLVAAWLVRSPNDVLSTASSCSPSTALRHIHLQAGLRLALWSRFGDAFVGEYCDFQKNRSDNSNKSKKKRTKTAKKPRRIYALRNRLFQDIVAILSYGAFRLDKDRSFASFLADCVMDDQTLPEYSSDGGDDDDAEGASKQQQRTLLPEGTIQNIFDYFEVAHPYKIDDNDGGDDTTISPPPSETAKAKTTKAVAAASNAPIQRQSPAPDAIRKQQLFSNHQSSLGPSDQGSFELPRSISLTAPSATSMSYNNSLLAGGKKIGKKKNTNMKGGGGLSMATAGRSRFVGSHFNTKLSNVSSLFREVKVASAITRKPQQQNQQQQRPLTIPKSSGVGNRNVLLPRGGTNKSAGSAIPVLHNSSNNKSHTGIAVGNSNGTNKKRRIGVVGSSRGSLVPETPRPAAKKRKAIMVSMRQPATSSSASAAARSGAEPTAANSTGKATISSLNQHRQQQPGRIMPPPPSNASLVAQAFRRASKRT